jgi:serine/threonine-protein kinase
MRRSLAVALVVFAASTPSLASAQNTMDPAAAEALFKQARQLMAGGKYADACPKLAESQRLDPGTGTLLNLATCYEKNGQIASAWATYKSAATAAQNANELDRAKLARWRAAALEAKLPTLTIVVPAAADRPDLTVTRDGEPVGRPAWGTPIPVDPGTHAVQASAPGRKTWHGQAPVDVAGAKASIEVPALEPDVTTPTPGATTPAPAAGSTTATAQPAAPEAPSTSSPGSTQRAIGLILGGVGIVSVGLAAVFGFVAKSDNDGVGGNCNQGVCNQQGLNSLDSAHTAATVSTIAFAAGGAALAGGALLYFLAPRVSSSTGLVVVPSAGAHAAGLDLHARW